MSFKKFVLLMIIGSVLMMTGCSASSYYTLASTEKETSTSLSMSYSKFNGHKSERINIDEPCRLDVEITTNSGSLDLTIIDEDGNKYYTGEDLSTTSFSVDIEKAGKYTLSFDAEDHSGGYKFVWSEPLK